ncbi:MAG: sensor domain-containing diguanylate cyclase [Deltaproteobacteria bacterium]|jgi:diguanylate cyclase (GGDEF)-like protein|nr:sensor domain-containing diguanylate cyclase [Deltaproteobacteria bacterium]
MKPQSFKDKAIRFAKTWRLVILAAIGAFAVGTGAFDFNFTVTSWYILLLLGVFIIAAGLLDIAHRLKGRLPAHFPAQIQGPLLWTVTAWMLLRMSGPYSKHSIIIPAGFIAWLVTTYPPKIFLFPILFAFIMEAGLTITGQQPVAELALNMLVYGLITVLLVFFARSQAYRKKLADSIVRAKKKSDNREYAKDLGITASGPSILETLPEFEAIENITDSFDLQLELIRQALILTTVAVLWPDIHGRELRLRNISTIRKDIQPGPYPIGAGITGALLRDRNEITLAPVKANFSGLPYYIKKGGVGSLLAVNILDNLQGESSPADRKISGILCVDRTEKSDWNESELTILKLLGKKLSLDINMGRQLYTMNRERNAFQQVCIGLRELNSVLGLEPVFDASIKAVTTLVQTDFIAISLLQDEYHSIVRAEGLHAKNLLGLEFSKNEGIVGQVMKINRSLPAGAEYRGPAPIFSKEQRFPDFGSLLILPLQKEKGDSIGALTVAARKPGVFTRHHRDILELIAAQVAIKIDLAQAHEQINKIATIDGLTNLANHRTFQHAFDVMLNRAQRRSDHLCLILCDIDYFKRTNDTYGHPFGDQALKIIAETLAETVRKVDLVARYGGEEFAIILEDSNEYGGLEMAERIRKKVEALSLHQDNTVNITISFGLAAFPDDGDKKSLLIDHADQALYKAKTSGRNCIKAWSEIT